MDLYDDYSGYDEDNPDLEQEMYLRDLEEASDESADDGNEEDSSEEGSSDTSDEQDDSSYDGSDACKNRKKIRSKNVKITEAYLAKQLAINIETYRDFVKFKYGDKTYIGRVIKKMGGEDYIFDAVEDGLDEMPKLKKFSLAKIKRIEK